MIKWGWIVAGQFSEGPSGASVPGCRFSKDCKLKKTYMGVIHASLGCELSNMALKLVRERTTRRMQRLVQFAHRNQPSLNVAARSPRDFCVIKGISVYGACAGKPFC